MKWIVGLRFVIHQKRPHLREHDAEQEDEQEEDGIQSRVRDRVIDVRLRIRSAHVSRYQDGRHGGQESPRKALRHVAGSFGQLGYPKPQRRLGKILGLGDENGEDAGAGRQQGEDLAAVFAVEQPPAYVSEIEMGNRGQDDS